MNVNIATFGRRCAVAALAAGCFLASAQTAGAQSSDSVSRQNLASERAERRHFYLRMGEGFATSILLHEAGHVVSAYAMGFRPRFGFDKGRPTIFSGINEGEHKRAQFTFSAAGLTVQDVLDELILDVPHERGSAFERGLLAGGIGTTLFYITIGRNAPVSDITVMSRTSNLSKGQVSLIFGSIAALHTVRISRDHRYANFFVMPGADGRLQTGISITTR
jgi:hypothetical protein